MAIENHRIKILAFGDSLTAGYQLPASQAYPAQIERLLKEGGIDSEVINAGVSGETSDQGLRRISWNLKQGPFDFVLLGLGANDGLRNLPLDPLRSNLEAIVKKFKASQAQVVLLGMKLPTNLDPRYRKKFEDIYEQLAKKEKLPFVPFLLEGIAADSLLNLEDQMHPNAKGHVLVAQNVLKTLKPLIEKRLKK